MPRSKEDWMAEGLKVLAESGVSGLTIDALSSRLGLTKGSFYHHFKDVQDYHEQLITYWADQYLSTADSYPQDAFAGLELLDNIMNRIFKPITEPEVAIRNWAHENNMVRSYVEEVEKARHGFVLHAFQMVTKETDQALLMADMLSTIMLGSMTSLPRIPTQRVLELYQEFKRLYGLMDLQLKSVDEIVSPAEGNTKEHSE
ncbi:MAG: TetR family transcriptional regulator [Anaerolineales bacterium]|nr:TetR family transcriptional regulator [Anaerolineales bacterium]